MRAIHQLVAGYSNGDAISNEARTLRGWFRAWGYRSEIYCETARILPELRRDARDLACFPSETAADDLVILHLSIGSDVNDLFAETPAVRVVRYHNVTPACYFQALNPQVARQLERGRQQMASLAGVADLNVADSRYNADELVEAGYPGVQVLPLALELRRLTAAPQPEVLSKYRDGKRNLLFVGRCAPNKRLEDLLYAFYYLQKFQLPDCRLIHVGSSAGTETYLALLKTLQRELGLSHVDFAGSVPESHLCAYYQVADVFLCMSEHEGFGIPLLEAMQAGVPVMAYASAAVPETLDGAGFLFAEKHFDELAVWIDRISAPGPLREGILRGQEARLVRYEQRNVHGLLRGMLSPWLDTARADQVNISR